MLKILESIKSTTRPGKGGVRVGNNGDDNSSHIDKHLPQVL